MIRVQKKKRRPVKGGREGEEEAKGRFSCPCFNSNQDLIGREMGKKGKKRETRG